MTTRLEINDIPEEWLPFIVMIGERPSLAPGEWPQGLYAGFIRADTFHVPRPARGADRQPLIKDFQDEQA